MQFTASCGARHVKRSNVRYNSERVTSTVSPYIDHSGLLLISNKASGLSSDQKLSPSQTSTSIQQPAPELACTSWMLLGDLPSRDQTLMGPGEQGCNAGVCTGVPSTLGPLVLGKADRWDTGPTGNRHPSGMSTRGQAILGHSMTPDDNTEATGNINGFSLSKAIYFLGCGYWKGDDIE